MHGSVSRFVLAAVLPLLIACYPCLSVLGVNCTVVPRRNSWNSWLHATKKVVLYQRHQLGRKAANDGVAATPPAKVFALSRDFKARAATSAEGQLPRGGEAEAAVKALGGDIDWFKLVVGTVRWLVQSGVATVKLAGVPTVLTLFCVLLVARQQREVQRLTSQLEELLEDLRNKIDE